MLIPLCDEIRRTRLPVITFLMVVMHLALFVSAMDGQWFTESARLHEVCFGSGINHLAYQNGDWLNFFTYWMLDKSWFALGANMAILLIFGPSLEDRAGRFLFLMIYILSGVAGGLFHAFFPSHIYPTIMTSGAVAGILGAYAVQIDLQTRIRTISMWYEHAITGTPICFLWIFAQVLLSHHDVCESGAASFAVIVGGFLTGVMLGYLTKEWTPNVIIWRAGAMEVVSRQVAQQLKKKASSVQRSRETTNSPELECPYCHCENHSPILENDGSYYYQCAAAGCRRLVFLSSQVARRLLQT